MFRSTVEMDDEDTLSGKQDVKKYIKQRKHWDGAE